MPADLSQPPRRPASLSGAARLGPAERAAALRALAGTEHEILVISW
jgi:hypothetical protein